MNPETGRMIQLRDGEKPPAGYYRLDPDVAELLVPAYNKSREARRRVRQIERGMLKPDKLNEERLAELVRT